MNSMKDALKKAGIPLPEEKETAKAPVSEHHQAVPVRQGGSAHSAEAAFNLPLEYTRRAEQVILDLRRSLGREYQNFTTSKIRNILAMVSEIYNDIVAWHDEPLSPELQSRIEYLKVRLVYECGREPKVIKPFVEKAGLLNLLNSIGDNKENFVKYARYMEALVAYHRFHGGKD